MNLSIAAKFIFTNLEFALLILFYFLLFAHGAYTFPQGTVQFDFRRNEEHWIPRVELHVDVWRIWRWYKWQFVQYFLWGLCVGVWLRDHQEVFREAQNGKGGNMVDEAGGSREQEQGRGRQLVHRGPEIAVIAVEGPPVL